MNQSLIQKSERKIKSRKKEILYYFNFLNYTVIKYANKNYQTVMNHIIFGLNDEIQNQMMTIYIF